MERRMAELIEQQQREKQALRQNIKDLEKQLIAKQDLELEIAQLRCKAKVMKQMGDEGDLEVQNYIEMLLEEIREKEDVLNAVSLEYDRGMEMMESDVMSQTIRAITSLASVL